MGGWNDVTDAYYGRLPAKWPYITKIVDPRIHTSLNEKNARLLNAKLRGRLVPREGADNISAQMNNALLDMQWDNARLGGSMMTKLSLCDMDTRLYGSKFVLVYWRYEMDEEEVTFDGNEMLPLDIRDCGMDSTASHIRDAKWFQYRQWAKLEDLESARDAEGKPIFKNLGSLKQKISESRNSRSSTRNEYTPRGLQLRGLEDHTGKDLAFPVCKIVTELRQDQVIVFSPEHKEILSNGDNPYKHKKIPVSQLRYFALQDDPLGESEVESVLPLWKAIQATICAYMDEVILKMRPPLKIIENAARIETIQYGPEAQWLVDRQDAVEEMRSTGDSLQFFQTTYQALVSAFNTALGDFSQGISSFGPFIDGNKTATEIKATEKQQNVRDQKNQNDLGEFITDIMLMWLKNNQQFLFSDPEKVEYLIKIVGPNMYSKFEKAGFSELEVPPEALQTISDIIEQDPNLTDDEIQELMETASIPKHPIVTNPNEKDPAKLKIKPKLSIAKDGTADLSIVEADLNGVYDYIPDIKSMALGAGDEMRRSSEATMQVLTANPVVIQLLKQQNYEPDAKELVTSVLDGLGHKDSERFLKKIETQTENGPMGGAVQNSGVGGLPNPPQADTARSVPESMARPNLGQDTGGIPQAI